MADDKSMHYKRTEKKYLKRVNDYFVIHKCGFVPPFNRKGLKKLIQIIVHTKYVVARGELVCHRLTRLLAIYDAIFDDGDYKLIKKKKWASDPTIYYVACEDAYPIIANAHAKLNHGGMASIMTCLGSKYRISEMAVKLFLSYCKDCEVFHDLPKEPSQNRRNESCKVAIRFVNKPDLTFKYLFIMVDNETNFVHLRPLVSRDDISVAIEMLKIFADFGAPFIIETNAILFFKLVYQHIERMCPDYAMSLVSSPINLSELTYKIDNYLNEWQNKTGSKNWAFGVHMIQWRLNNEEDFSLMTNFTNVFSRTPNRLPDWSHLPEDAENEAMHIPIALEPIDDTIDLDVLLLAPQIDSSIITQVTVPNQMITSRPPLSLRLDDKKGLIRCKPNITVANCKSTTTITTTTTTTNRTTESSSRWPKLTISVEEVAKLAGVKTGKLPFIKKRHVKSPEVKKLEIDLNVSVKRILRESVIEAMSNVDKTQTAIESINLLTLDVPKKNPEGRTTEPEPEEREKSINELSISEQGPSAVNNSKNEEPKHSDNNPQTKNIGNLLNNSNAGKITLLSVEIEEDSDGEEQILTKNVVCFICQKAILTKFVTCNYCKKDVHTVCCSSDENSVISSCKQCATRLKRKMGGINQTPSALLGRTSV